MGNHESEQTEAWIGSALSQPKLENVSWTRGTVYATDNRGTVVCEFGPSLRGFTVPEQAKSDKERADLWRTHGLKKLEHRSYVQEFVLAVICQADSLRNFFEKRRTGGNVDAGVFPGRTAFHIPPGSYIYRNCMNWSWGGGSGICKSCMNRAMQVWEGR